VAAAGDRDDIAAAGDGDDVAAAGDGDDVVVGRRHGTPVRLGRRQELTARRWRLRTGDVGAGGGADGTLGGGADGRRLRDEGSGGDVERIRLDLGFLSVSNRRIGLMDG
jgi:hypothetical protein